MIAGSVTPSSFAKPGADDFSSRHRGYAQRKDREEANGSFPASQKDQHIFWHFHSGNVTLWTFDKDVARSAINDFGSRKTGIYPPSHCNTSTCSQPDGKR